MATNTKQIQTTSFKLLWKKCVKYSLHWSNSNATISLSCYKFAHAHHLKSIGDITTEAFKFQICHLEEKKQNDKHFSLVK